MKTYYDILELDEKCSHADIKRQYRLLAKKHHPDLNQEQRAHEQFISIQRAYSTLSDPQRRANYDHGLKYVRTRKSYEHDSFQRSTVRSTPGSGKTAAERNRNYELNRQRARMKKMRKEKEDALYFNKFQKYAIAVSAFSIVLALSFFIDYGLSPMGETEQVNEKAYLFTRTKNPDDRDHFRISTDVGEHRIHSDLVDEINVGDYIAIQKSPFYQMIIGIDVMKENGFVRIKNTAFSSGFKFFSLLIIIALLTYSNKNKNEWAVNLTLLNLLVLAINLLILNMTLAN